MNGPTSSSSRPPGPGYPPQPPHPLQSFGYPGAAGPQGYPSPPPRSPARVWLWLLGAALVLGLGTCGGAVALVAWGASAEPGGVVLGTQLPAAKQAKLEERGLLQKGERVIVLYDGSLSLDLSEVSLVTKRAVVHFADKRAVTFPLAEIVSIDQRVENIAGDVLEIATSNGDRMRIEIAHLNGGLTFLNALEDEVRGAHPSVVVRRAAPR
jgi:hypothetical protein